MKITIKPSKFQSTSYDEYESFEFDLPRLEAGQKKLLAALKSKGFKILDIDKTTMETDFSVTIKKGRKDQSVAISQEDVDRWFLVVSDGNAFRFHKVTSLREVLKEAKETPLPKYREFKK